MSYVRKAIRFGGYWTLSIGLFLAGIFYYLYQDPEGVINFNGTPTSDPDIKLGAFLFTLIFPAIGALGMFLPKATIRKMMYFQLRGLPFLWSKKQ